ncbi:MAG: hypothetical protein LBU58_03725 [Clostridiales bacterium]|nr:hypothetical protein [Clostridiales bacterium]
MKSRQAANGVSAFDRSRSAEQGLTFVSAERYFAEQGLPFSDAEKAALLLVDADGAYTNAALLLSDQSKFGVQCTVCEGRAAARSGARMVFSGSLLQQFHEAFEFINTNCALFDRRRLAKGNLGYFPDALRELLLNAIVHRDYEEAGSTLVSIYDGYVEFVSPGGLVKGVSMKDVTSGGAAHIRNAVVANVFARVQLIGNTGVGIRRIMENYAGCLKEPVFHQAPASFSAMLPKMIGGAMPMRGHGSLKEELVLKAIASKGSITRVEVEAMLKSSRNTAITLLDGLMDEGKIVKIGTARTVRYILPQ